MKKGKEKKGTAEELHIPFNTWFEQGWRRLRVERRKAPNEEGAFWDTGGVPDLTARLCANERGACRGDELRNLPFQGPTSERKAKRGGELKKKMRAAEKKVTWGLLEKEGGV